MRGDVFRVDLRREDYGHRTSLLVESRVYDVRLLYTLRFEWGDPARLADYIRRLIGGTLHAWDDVRVDSGRGREMARALMPHWDAEIHRFMERMEYQDRHRGRRGGPMYFDEYENIRADQWDALRYEIWDVPKEDPKAKEKAQQLLMRNLDDGQLKSFKKDGTFRVTGKDKKVYTISTARSFNVKAEDGTRYCGQLADTPIEDQMLAQKLLLEHEPEKFFKNANVSAPFNSGSTAQEINMRYAQMVDMVRMRPGAIIPWDSSV